MSAASVGQGYREGNTPEFLARRAREEAATEHRGYVAESRTGAIGHPTRGVCSCGWKGTVYSFATLELRREHASHDVDLHERIMGGRAAHFEPVLEGLSRERVEGAS